MISTGIRGGGTRKLSVFRSEFEEVAAINVVAEELYWQSHQLWEVVEVGVGRAGRAA